MGAQRPVTFLTHFRIPFLPLGFLPRPGRPRGHRRSEEPPASNPQPQRAGCTRRRAPRGTGREPAPAPTPPPASPARPLPGHVGLRAPVRDFSPRRSPSRRPRRSPLPEGCKHRPLPFPFRTLLRSGRAGCVWGGAWRVKPSTKAPRHPSPAPPPPSPHPHPSAARGGGVRPPPARLLWKPGLLAGAGRDAAESGRGPRGRGQVAASGGRVCVRSEPPSPGRGRKLPSQLQLLSEQSNSATLPAPRPSPARPAGTGAAQRPGAPAPGPVGARPGCGRVGGSLAGDAGMAPLPWGGTGGAPPRDPVLGTTRGPRAAPRTPPAAPTGRPGARPGAEDGGGA